jgi:hypothetical protein
MKRILTAAVIGALGLATPVLALDPNSQSPTIGEHPDPSLEETGAINPVTLEPGENSFTENQAKGRIEQAGYTHVSALKLDEEGIWRGTANKGAMTVKVGLDFKGNVAAEHAAAKQ